MRVEEGFQPTPPDEGHPFETDPVLPNLLRRLLPSNVHTTVQPDLVRLGTDITTKIRRIADLAEPPSIVQYNHWGQRVDELRTSESWRVLKSIAQQEGVPGIFYERTYGEHSRVYGFAKVLMLYGDSQVVFCPLSMTDGCARALELYGSPSMKQKVLSRLISRNPLRAFTSGQWMTERPGGSDVSQTETMATPTDTQHELGPTYKLDGFKWFSSATDSNVSLALARTGPLSEGSRSLSLFLVPLRLPLLRQPTDPAPSPISNNILLHRLKNKIGTHIVPTAELSMNGAEAYLVGQLNQGVKNITPVLNITRVYSACASVGGLRRCLAISTAYAKVRTIRGGKQLLKDTPLHVAQLASIHLTYKALMHLLFGVIGLLGKVECNLASEDEIVRLRLLTPVVKAFSAEKAVAAMEDAMTTLGGQGYMEESSFGRAIRDGLVERIWEGTTNVLSVEIIRAAAKPGALAAYTEWAKQILASCPQSMKKQLAQPLRPLEEAIAELVTSLTAPVAPLVSRPALLLMGYLTSSVFLLEHVIWSEQNDTAEYSMEVESFRRWVMEDGLERTLRDVRLARTCDEEERSTMDLRMAFGLQSSSFKL